MTFGERVQAAAKKGFTERQARFLTTVMLQTGVCVPRQYARFCGIVYGAKTRKFFDRTRRAVLRGARGVLRPSIQGTVPSLETGRRAHSRQRGLPGDQRRVNAGAGHIETLELGHRYGHLAPLVAVA